MADAIVSGAVSVCKILHTCELCGKGFYPKRTNNNRFCGRGCGLQWASFKTAFKKHGGAFGLECIGGSLSRRNKLIENLGFGLPRREHVRYVVLLSPRKGLVVGSQSSALTNAGHLRDVPSTQHQSGKENRLSAHHSLTGSTQ